MSDAWAPAEFDAQLARAGRVVVLFHRASCAKSRAFAATFDEADVTLPLPFARAVLAPRDPRRRALGIRRTPTVVYFEHGEELERVEATPHETIDPDRFDWFLETIMELQEAGINERKLKRRTTRRRHMMREPVWR